MIQSSKIKAIFVLLSITLILSFAGYLAQITAFAQDKSSRISAGGWIADTQIKEEEDAVEFIFSGENENGYATQRVFSEQGFDVNYPIQFSMKINWKVPYPDSFGINFCRNNEEYENWAAGQVASDNRFQFLIDNRGYFIEPGAWADWYKDFEDKNRYPEPEYNDFVFEVGEKYTTVTINGITYGHTLRFKKSDFPQGRVYMSFGTIGTHEGYSFKLKKIDRISFNGSATRVIENNAHEPFYVEALSDFQVFAGDREINDFTFENGKLIFGTEYLKKLPIGKTELTLKSESDIANLTLFKETPEKEVGNWIVSGVSESDASLSGNEIQIVSEVFAVKYKDSVAFTNGLQLDFIIHEAMQYNDFIQFNIGNAVLKIDANAETFLSYQNGLKNEEAILLASPFHGVKHSIRLFFDNDDFLVTVDNKMFTPLLTKSQVSDSFAIEIIACFGSENEVLFSEPKECEVVSTGGLGFKSKLNSETVLNKDATVAFNISDENFTNSKGEVFSEERVYSEQGYDVNKPIILSVFYDVLNSGNGYYGFNITSNKYDFGKLDKFQDPGFDVKVEGIPRGSYLSGAKAAGSPVQIPNCRNLHYGSYVSAGLLNVFKIEIGLTQTKITVNGECEQFYSIRRSDFDASGGKAYFNFGFNTTNSSQKLQLVLKAINSPDPGYIDSRDYTIGKTSTVEFILKCADFETLVLKNENGDIIAKENYETDPVSGKLTFKEEYLKNLIQKEDNYRIKLCSSEDEKVGTWITIRGLKIDGESDSEISDEGILPDKSAPDLTVLWICLGVIGGVAIGIASSYFVLRYIKRNK